MWKTHHWINTSKVRWSLQSKKENVEEEEKALASIKKQVEEKALAAWNRWQLESDCKNCGKYGNKSMTCQKKKSEEKTNDTNSSTKWFQWKCFYYNKVGHRIDDCLTKQAAEEKAKDVIVQEKEQEND